MHTYIHTLECCSVIKKNEIMPFTATWMYLDINILSEVSQTQKDKYMIPFTYGIKKCRTHRGKFIYYLHFAEEETEI